MIFDTHVHLNDESYEDYHLIVNNALKENVKKFMVIGFDLQSSIKAVKIAHEYPFVYAAIGLHPDEANKPFKEDLKKIDELANDDKVICIGEIGLDYHYDDIIKENQKELFIEQLKIASKHNLPISIHSRDAAKDTVDLLKENKQYYKKGIMHCYSYSYEVSRELEKLGFKFAFGGVVTFKNARVTKEVVTKLDINSILLETDAPYLAPTPFRGTRNEPKYITYVAKEIAELKRMPLDKVEEIIYNNSCDFLGVSREN